MHVSFPKEPACAPASTPASSSPVTPTSRPSTPSLIQSDGGSMSGASSSSSGDLVPSHWSAATQKAVNEQKLDAKVRCDIVRTLATLLISRYGPQPRKSDIQRFAQKLILKYPFMRDDIGTGYVSTCYSVCTLLVFYVYTYILLL